MLAALLIVPLALAASDRPFAIVGDTQRTLWEERWLLGREQNDAESEFLLKDGALALVWLDSNKPELSKEQWEEQRAWYEQTLKLLDQDPGVRGVLTFDHHPPYTNSMVTGDEAFVQTDFLPAFYNSRKSLAW